MQGMELRMNGPASGDGLDWASPSSTLPTDAVDHSLVLGPSVNGSVSPFKSVQSAPNTSTAEGLFLHSLKGVSILLA